MGDYIGLHRENGKENGNYSLRSLGLRGLGVQGFGEVVSALFFDFSGSRFLREIVHCCVLRGSRHGPGLSRPLRYHADRELLPGLHLKTLRGSVLIEARV